MLDVTGLTGAVPSTQPQRPKVRLDLPTGASIRTPGSLASNDVMAPESLGETNTYRSRFSLLRDTTVIPENEGFMALVTTTSNSSSTATTRARSWTYVPPRQEARTYDADGNLRSDGRWLYTWDAENRLVRMEERALRYTIPDTSKSDPTPITIRPPRLRLEFHYDYLHRRSAKRVFTMLDGGTYVLTAHTRFLYDGWNLVAEQDALNLNSPLRTYVWGSDLSGTLQGAGGVGGLLLVKHHQTLVTASSGARTDKSVRYLVHSDANGNVMALRALDGSAGTAYVGLAAAFDYDPFGRRIVTALPVGQEACPIGFSSKYEDRETGMLYYGFRYYSPEMGRWFSRDPIGERGGINLYGMCGNDAVNLVDTLGLKFKAKGKCEYSKCCAENYSLMIEYMLESKDRYNELFDFIPDAVAKTPIPVEERWNPNITNQRQAWNTHYDQWHQSASHCLKCAWIVVAQESSGQCGDGGGQKQSAFKAINETGEMLSNPPRLPYESPTQPPTTAPTPSRFPSPEFITPMASPSQQLRGLPYVAGAGAAAAAAVAFPPATPFMAPAFGF